LKELFHRVWDTESRNTILSSDIVEPLNKEIGW